MNNTMQYSQVKILGLAWNCAPPIHIVFVSGENTSSGYSEQSIRIQLTPYCMYKSNLRICAVTNGKMGKCYQKTVARQPGNMLMIEDFATVEST